MNCIWKRAFAALLILVSQLAVADDRPVTTVPNVDLERYLGRWYGLAVFRCSSSVTASGDDCRLCAAGGGGISVRNRCRSGTVSSKRKVGRPRSPTRECPAEGFLFLAVLVRLLDHRARRCLPLGGGGQSQPQISLDTLPYAGARPCCTEQARTIAAAQGFDLAQLRMTRQLAE